MGLVQGGQIETITMGGVTLSTNKAIVLNVNCPGSKYQTIRKSGVFYAVPVGKKLVIRAVSIVGTHTTNAAYPYFFYADTIVDNSSTAPTNIVPIIGGSAQNNAIAASTLAIGTPHSHLFYAEIPAGKYPGIYSTTTDSVVFFLCELVDA